jgi:hypothetical protein
MPNVALTQANGLVVNLPANSITGVFSSALDKPPENGLPAPASVIFSTVKGLSVYSLAHPAKDVLEQIKVSLGKSKPQDFVIVASGDDVSAIQAETVEFFEQVKNWNDAGPETNLMIHFKDHQGKDMKHLASDTVENNERLNALAKD